MTPNDPRKFHIEDPQPASFQSERLSSIQASATACGVLLKQPHSPTCICTPLSTSGLYVSMFSLFSRARSQTFPLSSLNGHVGILKLSNSSLGTQLAV